MIGTGAFWTSLAKEIREARKNMVEQLAQGNFGDHVQAMRLVGQIAAFDAVMGMASRILGENQHPISQPEDEDDF